MNNNPPVVWRNHRELHKYLGNRGKIVAWTKVFVAPEGFEHEAPYVVAIVEFEDKSRMSIQVVDCDSVDLQENQEVEVVVRRIGKATADGLIQYGLKVRPAS
ncbi:MAG: OB-fold domain-containing protein [Candidatus Levybacteria bacterium]|nr:OB-fold domain-containing protein [Candidatus Levybacteria bacterium]